MNWIPKEEAWEEMQFCSEKKRNLQFGVMLAWHWESVSSGEVNCEDSDNNSSRSNNHKNNNKTEDRGPAKNRRVTEAGETGREGTSERTS